jgi:drug/metabolite transporter (DMT)-like permease
MKMTGPGRTVALTAAAMVAFAANSLLCRAALGSPRMDAVSFTALRLVSGAAVLAGLARAAGRGGVARDGSWASAWALFAYALAFSLAYTRIPTGTGALLLFGAVQITMIGHAVATGARLRPGEWLGLAVALVGLVVLTRPGLAAPDALGAALMVSAGVAWGVYTLRGRGAGAPLFVTAGNFVRAAVPALAVVPFAWGLATPRWTPGGAVLAVASGAIASGLGYAAWYAALPHLPPQRAALVQLSAPVLAALGGVLLLGEAFDGRLAMAAPLVLGGIALGILTGVPPSRSRLARPPTRGRGDIPR